MGSHKTQTEFSRKFCYFVEQCSKSHIVWQIFSVGIDVLPEKGYFFVSFIQQTFHFFENVFQSTAAFTSPDVGNDTVGAKVVATVVNVHPCIGITCAILRKIFFVVHAKIRIDKFFAVLSLHNGIFKHMKVAGAQNNVNEGIFLPDYIGYAFLLRHASAHSNDFFGIFTFEFFQLSDVPVNFLFGSFSYAAGVEHHNVCLIGVFAFGIAQFTQHSCNFFRIMNVHLTPVGVNKVLQK